MSTLYEELLHLTKKYINLEDSTAEEDKRREELWRRYTDDAKTFSLIYSPACCKVCDCQDLTLNIYIEIIKAYNKKGYGFYGRLYADRALSIHRKTEQFKCLRSHL